MNSTQPQRAPLYLLGLVGQDIQGSLSPLLHETEAQHLGLRCAYPLLDFTQRQWGVEQLPDTLAAMQQLGFAGCNVTHPFKQAIMPYLDHLSPQAEALGAVNTVVFQNNVRIGYNTDCTGFSANFRRHLAGVRTTGVLQLGAGGAGFAVAHAMLELGAEHLQIYDSDNTRSQALAQRLSQHFSTRRVSAVTEPQAALKNCDGLIQATPIGMLGHPGMPIDPQWLQADQWVAEVIYVPLETELLRQAQARGCRTMHGGGMVVFQAAEAFQHFTGHTPDTERMMAHFMRLIS